VEQHQAAYLEGLKELDYKTKDQVTALRQCTGALMWPAHSTCPHLSFDTGYLAGLATQPSRAVFNFACKLVRRARQQKEHTIRYHQIEVSWGQLVLVTFSDAGWATRPSGHSQAGCLTTLAHPAVLDGVTVRANLVEYGSCKIILSGLSSYDAEFHAMQVAAEAT